MSYHIFVFDLYLDSIHLSEYRRWQFTTEGYDIGFGVYKKKSEVRMKSGDMEEVMVNQRVNSHFVPEDGSLCCREVGICKFFQQNISLIQLAIL